MKRKEAERWQQALSGYSYPVRRGNAVAFRSRIRVADSWFSFDLERGDRDQTLAFEGRFRTFGPKFAEAWYEVIFWKLASTGRLGEDRAERMIGDLKKVNSAPARMWAACSDFVKSSTRAAFENLQQELFIVSGAIPVAATFPAFAVPESFPMVDKWIADWVVKYRNAYPDDPRTNDLVAPSKSFVDRKKTKKTTLKVSGDWEFYRAWIEWCRCSARILSAETGTPWRARDVEMAAFSNARSLSPLLPAVSVP
jgi:hypothetical protein